MYSNSPFPILAVFHNNQQYLLETYQWDNDLKCQWINSCAIDAYKRHFARQHSSDNVDQQVRTLECIAHYLIDSGRFDRQNITIFIHGGRDDGLRIM